MRTDFADTLEGPAEAHALALDPTLAEADLGISGLWGLEQTVSMTAQWYRNFLSGRAARELCEADCCAYLDSVRRASMAGAR